MTRIGKDNTWICGGCSFGVLQSGLVENILNFWAAYLVLSVDRPAQGGGCRMAEGAEPSILHSWLRPAVASRGLLPDSAARHVVPGLCRRELQVSLFFVRFHEMCWYWVTLGPVLLVELVWKHRADLVVAQGLISRDACSKITFTLFIDKIKLNDLSIFSCPCNGCKYN